MGWPERMRKQRCPPVLGGGLEQRLDVDVERAEPDPQPVQRVAVLLVERDELGGDRPARQSGPPESTSIAASARIPGVALRSAAASRAR